MTEFTNIPLQNAFEVTLENSVDATAVSITLSTAPSFTLPVGQGVYAVIDPKNSYREVIRITAIVGAVCTIERGKTDYDAGVSTARAHSGGAIVVITNTYQVYDELADAVNSKVDIADGQLTEYADVTARDAAITSPENGMQVYLTAEGYFTDYVGGSWLQRDTGSVTPNASSTVAGKVELATESEVAAGTGTGGSGAELVVPNDSTGIISVSTGTADAGKIPRLNATGSLDVSLISGFQTIADRDDSYTPAYLTSGASVFSTFNLWVGVSDGAFQISIDGAALDITGIDFSAVTDMDDVAETIQTAIRAETSALETCTWSGTALVITSIDTTVSSVVTVTTAGTAGTDISGAGANDYMDSDTGHGTATAAALSIVGDAGKLVAIDTDGYINNDLFTVVKIEEFSASGTWTKDTGLKYVEVEMWGAGGSGGCAIRDGACSSGGGGGGAYYKQRFIAGDLGATETVTVGAGGAAVTDTDERNSTQGLDGTDSTFGSLFTVSGGAGGSVFSASWDADGGAGGDAIPDYSLGMLPFEGGAAGNGGVSAPGEGYYGGGGGGGNGPDYIQTGADAVWGGAGGGGSWASDEIVLAGTSTFGGNGGNGAGNQNAGTTTTADDGVAPGGGGGAGLIDNATGTVTSGKGGDGFIRITEFY